MQRVEYLPKGRAEPAHLLAYCPQRAAAGFFLALYWQSLPGRAPATDGFRLFVASMSLLLPDAAFEARIADGTIHPGLERRPAVE
jgi:hypothetical protein